MRTGETLIKLAKHRVEAVQTLIVAAEKTRADLLAKLDALANQDARERALVERDPAQAPTYIAFVHALTLQRGNIDASLAGVDHQIEALRGDLAMAFEEQKKFEMLEERRVAREEAARAKRASAFMDEAALMRAARA
jgi:flagellar export protein FliJ